jgi:uncharacterized LabA/DUF88 family protein
MERVIAYVDGYNLYYGLHDKRWKWFYWLNVQAIAKGMLKPHQTLVATKYFTTVVARPEDKRLRQAAFLDALSSLTDFSIYYGQYLSSQVICKSCGHTYTTYHEKMTDVNIAVEMLADAFQDKFDTGMLVSADSDLTGPVLAVRRLFPHKRIVVAFPPNRTSFSLKSASHGVTFIGRNVLSKSIFPDDVVRRDGKIVTRPKLWR